MTESKNGLLPSIEDIDALEDTEATLLVMWGDSRPSILRWTEDRWVDQWGRGYALDPACYPIFVAQDSEADNEV